MNLFKPEPGFKVSHGIVAINTLLFLILAGLNLSFSDISTTSLYAFGANYSPAIEQGQWWRFLTSIFLHLSLMHLIFNCVSLLFVGRMLEPLLGYFNFAGLYLITGIIASATSFTFNKGVLSAGASGAVFGLFGVFIAVLLTNIIRKDIRDEWLKTIGALVAINLGMGLFLRVDNAAHIGGLLSGIILGFAFIPIIKKRIIKQLHNRQKNGL